MCSAHDIVHIVDDGRPAVPAPTRPVELETGEVVLEVILVDVPEGFDPDDPDEPDEPRFSGVEVTTLPTMAPAIRRILEAQASGDRTIRWSNHTRIG